MIVNGVLFLDSPQQSITRVSLRIMYTGVGKVNRLIMSFEKGELQNYYSSELIYPQKFASYGLQKDRLTKETFDIINTNQDFHLSGNL